MERLQNQLNATEEAEKTAKLELRQKTEDAIILQEKHTALESSLQSVQASVKEVADARDTQAREAAMVSTQLKSREGEVTAMQQQLEKANARVASEQTARQESEVALTRVEWQKREKENEVQRLQEELLSREQAVKQARRAADEAEAARAQLKEAKDRLSLQVCFPVGPLHCLFACPFPCFHA